MPDEASRIERDVRWLKAYAGITTVLLVAVGVAAFTPQQQADVLRARGLVIEDSTGQARVLMGAPVPAPDAWKEPGTAKGLVVLDGDGRTRVSVGYPANPRIHTSDGWQTRLSPGAGLTVHDTLGHERAGMGVLDIGRAVVRLDYPTREGVSLILSDETGSSGLVVWGRQRGGGNPQRLFLGSSVTRDSVGPGMLKLNDGSGRARAQLLIDDGRPRLRFYSTTGSTTADITGGDGPTR